MAFTRITNEDRLGKGNVGQPDTPLLSATEMQEQMDSLPNLAIDKFNAFLDELAGPNAALNIGCTAPVGVETQSTTLFGILNAIAAMAISADDLAHTHPNKEMLDLLSDNLMAAIMEKMGFLAPIEGLETTLTDNANALPTSSAVVAYINNTPLSAASLEVIYPIGAIYQTMSTAPDVLFGGTWELIKTDHLGIKTYVRTQSSGPTPGPTPGPINV